MCRNVMCRKVICRNVMCRRSYVVSAGKLCLGKLCVGTLCVGRLCVWTLCEWHVMGRKICKKKISFVGELFPLILLWIFCWSPRISNNLWEIQFHNISLTNHDFDKPKQKYFNRIWKKEFKSWIWQRKIEKHWSKEPFKPCARQCFPCPCLCLSQMLHYFTWENY